jgi:iron complex transport system ATP-binding protein
MRIKIENIEFAYNGTAVLEAINCEIGRGDFIAVVGPNGSGKSTLIKCINGILKPRKGNIFIENENILKIKKNDVAKTIAYVPQINQTKTPLSVFDTILLGRKPYIHWKPSESDLQITADLIEQLNIGSIAMKDINKLSGGQQQTVFIARALAQQTDILLLDEPTASLDLRHSIEIMEILKNLANNGLTVIVALHDINIAMRYATKFMMLKQGRIFAHGGREIITEENLELLYDIKIRVIENNNEIYIMPLGVLAN